MNKPVKIQSKMNGMGLTHSEGEHSTKPGDVIVSTFYGGMKQQWYIGTSS